MTTIPQLPVAPSAGATDLVALSQGGTLYAASVEQITTGLQQEIILPTGDLLGRVSAGAGEPEAIMLGVGLGLQSATLAATGTDHVSFPLLDTFSISDEVVINAAGKPSRLPMAELRGLFTAGSGVALDADGILSVTASAIAGPAGPVGPAGPAGLQGAVGPAGATGAGLMAPGVANATSTIAGSDYVAIWQNGSNAWISYQQLIGGQTIDQLPAAGPVADSDLLLVAQGGNALSSQSFASIWTYVAQKIPTMRQRIVELNSNTVLDATTHNQRILVVSQPMTLSANFTNMGSGFACRLINLSAGVVTMGTGIVSGTGVATVPPGAEADIVALTYSGGSIVWWNGVIQASPTITVDPITPPAAGVAFNVSGGLFDETPNALDYSTDGVTWMAASAPVIETSTFSFQVPGLVAGTYTVSVRDHDRTSVVGKSAPFTIAAASISINTAPASVAAGSGIVVDGSVVPSGTLVQVGLSSSTTTKPTSFSAATISGGTWSATIPAGTTPGTVYLWAEQTADPATQAVSGAIAVTAVVSAIAYTINQPPSTSIALGSGSVALNGGVSPSQTTATQVALSLSNTTPPTEGWQAASIIDNDAVWAVYTTVPAAAGSYYVWVETATGEAPTVSTFVLTVS